MYVITAGRTDVEEFFRLSDLREAKRLVHHPLLVFVELADGVEVRIVDNAVTLLTYPDETKVMVRWGGRWRADYYQFRVGQFRQYVAQHPKQAFQIV